MHKLATMKRSAVVLGASGYSGGELLRLLARHEAIDVVAAAGDRTAGEPLGLVHPHLASLSGEIVTAEAAVAVPADVCFSCLPGGHLSKHLDDLEAAVLVDLADDFRAEPQWTYGLTEFARREVAATKHIANPGCYPTATLLALVPFARAGLVEGPVVVDAISGTSGAGRKPAEHLSLAHAGASVTAYGSVAHRHVPEIERGLHSLGGLDASVSFTPHLAPMSRGLLATVRARLAGPLTDSEANEVLHDAYEGEAFVEVREDWPSTKATTGSNGAHVGARVDARTGWLVCSAAIDNLGKGAAGQALQNANLALGLPEGQGLEAAGVWP
jgi:N-acetyl-gamma-glutamyl-phosphate reductase